MWHYYVNACTRVKYQKVLIRRMMFLSQTVRGHESLRVLKLKNIHKSCRWFTDKTQVPTDVTEFHNETKYITAYSCNKSWLIHVI